MLFTIKLTDEANSGSCIHDMFIADSIAKSYLNSKEVQLAAKLLERLR